MEILKYVAAHIQLLLIYLIFEEKIYCLVYCLIVVITC